MKAPVSWIREYVDLPADVTTEELAAELTALGLKLEAIEKPGDQITGPLVVGRVLTLEPEPQKNGKTINWCTVDVGPDANGTGEPAGGIVCGAHNFAAGDLVVVVLPGGVLPGDFEISARKTYGHVSAGMICSTAELGPRRRPRRHHRAARRRRRARRRRLRRCSACATRSSSSRSTPTGPTRCRCAASPARRRWPSARRTRDPAQRDVPRRRRPTGYPVVVDDPQGCPVFVARTVTGFDPAAPTPDWMARRLTQAGHAADLAGRRRHQLRDARAGPADPRLRRRQARRAPIRVRRAAEGERLPPSTAPTATLSTEDLVVTDDSGIIGLGGVMGGETTEMSATTTRVLIEAAHWDAVSMFRTGKRHKLTSEAGKRNERGVDPTICEAAADRVVELLVDVRRRHRRPRRHRGRRAARPAARSGWPTTCPPGSPASTIDADTAVAHLEAVGCAVDPARDARRRRRRRPGGPT